MECSTACSPAPQVPRDQWLDHPHYPAQTLLLGSHDNFRRISRHLVAAAERGESTPYVGGLYKNWIAAMRSHEGYEEGKLYPYLARRWCVSFDEAAEGHQLLHARDAEVRQALKLDGTLQSNDASANGAAVSHARATLVDALKAHDTILHTHLELEERLVIPLLLEMSPEEFMDYTTYSIGTLLHRLNREPSGRE